MSMWHKNCVKKYKEVVKKAFEKMGNKKSVMWFAQ